MNNWRVAVGSLSSWSGWVISITLGLRLLVALISDPNRTGNYSPLWLVVWALGVAAMALLVLLAMALGLGRRLKEKPSPWGNLITIGLAGTLGNFVVAMSAFAWGLDTEQLWHIRLGGGALAAILEFSLVNLLRANFVARRESIRQLIATENQLLGYHESAKQIIADEIDALKRKTQDALLPAINKIQDLLTQAHTYANVVQDLKLLINEEVRPLSKDILQEAVELSNIKPFKNTQPRIRWRNTFLIRQSLRPGIAAVIFGMTFPMIEFMLIDHRSALRGLLGGLASGLTILLIKLAIPKKLELSTPAGISLTSLIALISIGPSYWVMWQEYGLTPEINEAASFQAIIAVLGAILLSYTKAIEENQKRYQIALANYTHALQKEVALFEQKLGLEKRAWSRIIHGEVQSALTAAVTRLQREEHLEPYHLELIKQDLNRAKDNLLNPPKENINFTQSFSEIVLTWKSICDIKADISARAQRAVDQNPDVRTVTNEIIKEAVSNAVRHGQAKNIQIKLDRIKDDLLDIEITNDGFSPQRDKTPGLGSQMLNELTLSWSLETNKNKTVLKAQVPIGKN